MLLRERELFINHNFFYDHSATGVLKYISKIQKASGERYLETGGLIKGLAVDPACEEVLNDLGINAQDVWKKVEEKTGSIGNRLEEARETVKLFSKEGSRPKFYQRGVVLSESLKEVLSAAQKSCKKRGSCEITSLDLLMGVALSGKGFAYDVLEELGVGRIALMTRIRKEQGLNADPKFHDPKVLYSSPGLRTRVRKLIRRGSQKYHRFLS